MQKYPEQTPVPLTEVERKLPEIETELSLGELQRLLEVHHHQQIQSLCSVSVEQIMKLRFNFKPFHLVLSQ